MYCLNSLVIGWYLIVLRFWMYGSTQYIPFVYSWMWDVRLFFALLHFCCCLILVHRLHCFFFLIYSLRFVIYNFTFASEYVCMYRFFCLYYMNDFLCVSYCLCSNWIFYGSPFSNADNTKCRCQTANKYHECQNNCGQFRCSNRWSAVVCVRYFCVDTVIITKIGKTKYSCWCS